MSELLKRQTLALGMLFLPATLMLASLVLYPAANGVRLSFTNASPLSSTTEWVAFGNYIFLMGNADFWQVIGNSAYLILVSVAISVFLGFSLALLLTRDFGGAAIYRAGILQIWIVPWITIAILWTWIFNSEFGIVNHVLEKMGLIHSNLPWLTEDWSAQVVIILGFTWRSIPLMMIISIAAIQTIPHDILEAAAIDGAGAWQRLRRITLPAVRNMLVVIALLQSIRLFQEITLPWIVTRGGPGNATTTLSIYTYKTAFLSWEFGLASAAGTIWMIGILLFSWVYLRLLGQGLSGR